MTAKEEPQQYIGFQCIGSHAFCKISNSLLNIADTDNTLTRIFPNNSIIPLIFHQK